MRINRTTLLRLASAVIGAVLLVAGVPKTFGLVDFVWSLLTYARALGFQRYIGTTEASAVALLLGPTECFIGLALLLAWRHSLAIRLATLLIGVFLIVSVHVASSGIDVDCGCFGALGTRSPGVAVATNLVLFALSLVVLIWYPRPGGAISWANYVVLGGTAASFLVGTFEYVKEGERLDDSDLVVGASLSDLQLVDKTDFWIENSQLLVLFDPLCPHCRRIVPTLNKFHQDSETPRVLALTSALRGPTLEQFRRLMRPAYPIRLISSNDFMRLTWRFGVPRFAYLENRVVKSLWASSTLPKVGDLTVLTGR